jgi:hypothetical protein
MTKGGSSWNVFNSNSDVSEDLSFESLSFRLVHDDMSAKPCDNYKMIIVNYADLWLVHTKVVSQLNGAKLELRELKAHSLLLGTCTSYPLLKFDLDACVVEIKELKHKLDHFSRYSVSPLRVKRVALSMISFSMLTKRTLR